MPWSFMKALAKIMNKKNSKTNKTNKKINLFKITFIFKKIVQKKSIISFTNSIKAKYMKKKSPY